MTSMITLADYFDEWVDIYKLGAVRDVTLKKYRMSSQWVHRLAPNLWKSKVVSLDAIYDRGAVNTPIRKRLA